MKKLLLLLFLVSVVSFAQTQNQPPGPPSVSAVLDRGLSSVEKEFVDLADAMPEGKFTFVPTNGEFKTVRNFAQQLKHVAAVNYVIGASVLGEKPPVDTGGENGPENLKSKAEVMKFVRDSFEYAHRATKGINENNLLEPIKAPFGSATTTRLAMATLVTNHIFDHYGQLVVYLRMNGIVPPASRRQ